MDFVNTNQLYINDKAYRRFSLLSKQLKQSKCLNQKETNEEIVKTELKTAKPEEFIRQGNTLVDYFNKDCVIYNYLSDNVMEVVLNEPKRLNCIIYEILLSLFINIKKWVPEDYYQIPRRLNDEIRNMQILSRDKVPKVVFMSGKGKSFCAGADLTTMYKFKFVPGGMEKLKLFANQEYLLIHLLIKMKPVQIVHWNGTVIGGGVGISINAPFRIATENTIFAMPENSVGFFPDAGSSWFIPRIFNNNTSIGLFFGLTGHRVQGRDLARCGIATHYILEQNIPKLKQELQEVVTKDITGDQIKSIIDKYAEDVYDPKKFYFANEEFINKIFKFDSLKSIIERLEAIVKLNENPKEVKFAKGVLGVFSRLSPNSLVITFELLKRGTNFKKIEEAFAMESVIAAGCMDGTDLFEGIRCGLMSKGEKPKWEYKSVKEVDVEKVINHHFHNEENAKFLREEGFNFL